MREDMDEKMDAAADVQESTEGGGKRKLDVTAVRDAPFPG